MSAQAVPTVAIRQGPAAVVRWGAVFAGLAVAVALHLMLTMLGTAFAGSMSGLTGAPGVADSAVMNLLQVASVLVAAFFGGFVAARSSGLARAGDGALHGLVCWGVLTLLFTLVSTDAATMLTGRSSGSAFLDLPDESGEEAGSSMESPEGLEAPTGNRRPGSQMIRFEAGGGRAAAMATVAVAGSRHRLGHVSRMLPSDPGHDVWRLPSPSTHGSTAAFDAVAGGRSIGWLCIVLPGSLAAAMGGGVLGARGLRRRDPFAMGAVDRRPF